MSGHYAFNSKIRVAISGVCNLRCRYCDNAYNNSGMRIMAMEDFRSRPFHEGCISTDEYVMILKSFLHNGFTKVDFTGGEPMTNNEWDYLVAKSKELGFESVEMTTNGTLIQKYLDEKAEFPAGLDRLIISLDTYDPSLYCDIVGVNYDLNSIVEAVRRLKQSNPKLKLTANKVLTKSDVGSIEKYIDFIRKTGFDSITFLDLVVRDKRDWKEVQFFIEEFYSGEEIKRCLEHRYGQLAISEGRHDYNVVLPNGIMISVVDTRGLTRRDERCMRCKHFCQEGFYTAKVATDGTIIDCLGEEGILIDGKKAIADNSLDVEIAQIYERLANGVRGYYFDRFYNSLKNSPL